MTRHWQRLRRLQHALRPSSGKLAISIPMLIQLGILLPTPASLKHALASAASGQQGFLMREQPRIAGNQHTTVAFATGTFR